MVKRCHIFEFEDPQDAYDAMDVENIEDYGDVQYGHFLHVWDDGKRMLKRCRKCGAYILYQRSEYHGFSDDDSYYSDWFPVDGPDDADRLNKEFDGWSIEREFQGKWLAKTNGNLRWMNESKG